MYSVTKPLKPLKEDQEDQQSPHVIIKPLQQHPHQYKVQGPLC